MAWPDDTKVIVSAWESTPYGVATDVQRQDRFWIKNQPYSLQDMMAGDESVPRGRYGSRPHSDRHRLRLILSAFGRRQT